MRPDFLDDREADERYDEARDVTCYRCGKTGLEWVDCGGVSKRWQLFDGKRPHKCPEPDALDDFEDLTK